MNVFRTRLSAVACLSLVATAPIARGGVDSITITDGTVDFTINNLTASAVGSTGGMGNLRTNLDTTPVSHTLQNWFWFRNTDDARERALSNQTLSGDSVNHARLTYVEASNDGANPNALLVELEYTLHDLSNGGPPQALLVIGFKLQNLTDAPLNVQFYNYNDFDLGGSSGGDSAVVIGADDQTHIVSDGTDELAYSCSGTNRIHYLVAGFPAVRNLLTDFDDDDLNDVGSPFGPGNYSGANQWGVQLQAAGNSVQSTLVGSVSIMLTRNTCPADANEDGAVDVDDLIAVILSWGVCP